MADNSDETSLSKEPNEIDTFSGQYHRRADLRPALVFGQVPLFYFTLHLPLIHLLAVVLCYLQNGAVHWMFESPDLGTYPFTPPPDWGLSLPWIYLLWVAVVVMLYPVCAWFAGVKRRQASPWLSYL